MWCQGIFSRNFISFFCNLKNADFDVFININEFEFKDVGFDKKVINRIIDYYSISYLEVRQNPDNQLVF